MTEQTLTGALARWDELTDAEKGALIAVHVHEWHKGVEIVTVGRARSIPVWFNNKDEVVMPTSKWNPLTDANNMIETVWAFMQEYFGEHEWAIFDEKMAQEIYRIASHSNAPCATLVPLPDICHALLQALAESEA